MNPTKKLLDIREPVKTASPENNNKQYRYETINLPLRNTAIALLHDCHMASSLAEGGQFDFSSYEDNPKKRANQYLLPCLDFLVSQGILEKADTIYTATEEGRQLLGQSEIIKTKVEIYEKIVSILEGILNFKEKGTGIANSLSDIQISLEQKLDQLDLETFVVPAVSVFYNLSVQQDGNDKDKKIGDVLREKEGIDLKSLLGSQINDDIKVFYNVLRGMDIVQGEMNCCALTEKGIAIFKLGGYADATISYYKTLQKLHPLLKGVSKYGEDVMRHPKFNAIASNGIIKIKVAPYIVDNILGSFAKEYGKKVNTVDFGSGGGDMAIQSSKQTEYCVGIDITKGAVEIATSCVKKENLGNKISFIHGSILDSDSLKTAKRTIEAKGSNKIIGTINFILHDIGKEKAKEFLQKYAEVFGDAPLVITETFRVPLEILQAHPDYQAPSFQFFHDISGQELFKEQELRDLLQECGYIINNEKMHSSMPGQDGERYNTIGTFVVQKKNTNN